MKILRVRRGFSTNCSGANEYFPPNQPLAPPGEDEESDWSAENAKVVFRWVTFMPDGAPPPMLREAIAASSNDEETDGGVRDADALSDADAEAPPVLDSADATVEAGSSSVNEDLADRVNPEGQVRGSGSIGLILFLGMLCVLVLFGVKRFGRGLWTKLKKGSDDDAGSS